MKLDGWSVNTHNHFTKNDYTVRPYIDSPTFFIELPNGKYHKRDCKSLHGALKVVERLILKEGKVK